jgi:hypothetical protein
MVTYEDTYRDYARFCNMLGNRVLPFEDWMQKRDDAPKTAFEKTKEFLSSRQGGSGLSPEVK